MSAWIVTKGHIDVLVQAAIVDGLASFDKADEVGTMLWTENYRSIEARYGDDPDVPAYHFTGVEAPLDGLILYKQLRCYEYQTCEHEAWEASASFALVQELGTRCLGRLGVTDDHVRDDPRWGAAPWGVESIDEALAA